MSDSPKIQVTDRELWLLKYYDKLLPKWECEMWSKLSDVTESNDTVVEVYLLTERHGYCGTKFVHEFKGYAIVDLSKYITITEKQLLR